MSGTLKRRSTKNKEKQRDTFSDTWGTSTARRSGTPRQLRPGLAQEEAILRSEPARPVTGVTELAIALDKPLPALPPDERSTKNPKYAKAFTESSTSSMGAQEARPADQQVDTCSSSSNNKLGLMSKLGLSHRASKRSASAPLTQNQPSQPSPTAPIPAQPMPEAQMPHLSISQNLVLRKISNTPRDSTAVVLSQLLSTPTYVDASTQTSPRLVPMHKTVHVAQASAHASPRTLSTSRKGSATKKSVYDYFSIPVRQERSLSSTAEEGPSTDLGSVIEVPAEKHKTKDPDAMSSKSGDSIGTYESRYSSSAAEAEATGKPKRCRAAISDSSLRSDRNSDSTTSTQTTSARPPMQVRSVTSDRVVGRPMPIPFTRLPSFSIQRGRGKTRSTDRRGRSSNSPLRRSIQMPDTTPTSIPSPPSPSIYQQLVLAPEPQSEHDYHIPDHLKGSPLCPRSPKHASGGIGFCPMHGGSDGSGSSTPPSTMVSNGKPNISDSRKGYTDGSYDDTAHMKYKLGAFRQDAQRRNCAANTGSKGLCVLQKRFKFKVRSRHVSEESVNRLRLRRC